MNGALRESSTFLFVLLLLSVASAAAVSMTSEREQDTWTSLTGTLLTDREIVMAKIRGALWSSKRLVLALLIMWSVGLLAGAIFPLGVLAAVVGLFVFCGFTAALGVWISLRAKNSTRALFATIFWLLMFNIGYLIVIPAPVLESDLSFAGVMPFMQWAALVSYPDVSSLASAGWFRVEGSTASHGGGDRSGVPDRRVRVWSWGVDPQPGRGKGLRPSRESDLTEGNNRRRVGKARASARRVRYFVGRNNVRKSCLMVEDLIDGQESVLCPVGDARAA